MNSWLGAFIRYSIVGVLNSAIGLAFIFICMALGANYLLANFLGFAFGLAVSFVLNGKWTFGRAELDRNTLFKFIVLIALAYLSNLLAILIMRRWFFIDSAYCQIVGVAVYAAVAFLGMKLFVFRGDAARDLRKDSLARGDE